MKSFGPKLYNVTLNYISSLKILPKCSYFVEFGFMVD